MKVTKVKIKKLAPVEGLIGFCSFVIDGWLYIGNVAIFARKDKEGEIRLVFPEKKVNNKIFKIFHPLDSRKYFELEQSVRTIFYEI